MTAKGLGWATQRSHFLPSRRIGADGRSSSGAEDKARGRNKVVRPARGGGTKYPLMFAETDVRRIDFDPTNAKRVWYAGVLSSRMGYIELLP